MFSDNYNLNMFDWFLARVRELAGNEFSFLSRNGNHFNPITTSKKLSSIP